MEKLGLGLEFGLLPVVMSREIRSRRAYEAQRPIFRSPDRGEGEGEDRSRVLQKRERKRRERKRFGLSRIGTNPKS